MKMRIRREETSVRNVRAEKKEAKAERRERGVKLWRKETRNDV
jgi:hypothetical protein